MTAIGRRVDVSPQVDGGYGVRVGIIGVVGKHGLRRKLERNSEMQRRALI